MSQQIAFVHIFRGVAALLVFWVHTPGWWLLERHLTWYPFELYKALIVEPLRLYQNGGHLGVVLFFIISGYVITHVASRESASHFVIKRIARLAPTLLIALCLMAIYVWAAGYYGLGDVYGSKADKLAHYIRTFFLIAFLDEHNRHALSVVWTLVPEVIFYLMTLGTIIWSRVSPATATILMLLAVFAMIVPHKWNADVAISTYWTIYIPLLIIGRVFYLHETQKISPQQTIGLTAASLLLMFSLYSTRWPGQLLTPGQEPIVTYLGGVTVIFLSMSLKIQRTPKLLGFFADISYALYLVHIPVGMLTLSAMEHVPIAFAWKFATMAGFTIALATLITWHVERPAQALARRWLERRRSDDRATTPAALPV